MDTQEIEVLQKEYDELGDLIDKLRDDWYNKYIDEHPIETHTDSQWMSDYSKHMMAFNEDEGNLILFKRLSFIGKTIRMNKSYELEDLDDIGTLFTMEDFIDNCNCGGFIDYDGFGYYATENQQSNICIYPSDIKSGLYRKDFTHVKWYNR